MLYFDKVTNYDVTSIGIHGKEERKIARSNNRIENKIGGTTLSSGKENSYYG
jgi:hypothetical protein